MKRLVRLSLLLLLAVCLRVAIAASLGAMPQIINGSAYDPGEGYPEHDVPALWVNGAGGLIAMPGLRQIGLAVLGVTVIVLAVCVWAWRRRRRHLTERYGDPEIARRIMRGVIWEGETAEQLIESLGHPKDIDQKVLKTKTKEIWKYRPTARNRFGLKVTLDDGVVAGWEKND